MLLYLIVLLYPSISNTINKCLPKTFNFLNPDTPCCKKAKACEKIFTKTVVA